VGAIARVRCGGKQLLAAVAVLASRVQTPAATALLCALFVGVLFVGPSAVNTNVILAN
jgi:hypothetical protein